MSVIITASDPALKVPWMNELLLIKPLHPDTKESDIKYGSHVRTVLTIYFDGFQSLKTSKDNDEPWKISVIQRGNIYEDSIDTEFCYKSLTYKDSDNSIYSFYNDILNHSSDKRSIVPGSLEGYIDFKLSGQKRVDSVFAQKLDISNNKKDGNISLEKFDDNYTVFNIHGRGPKSRIFRFSYASCVALDKGNRRSKYSIKNKPVTDYYIQETFKLESPKEVIEKIEKSLKGEKSKIDIWRNNYFDKKIESVSQDLSVVGDPTAFDYMLTEGSTQFTEHHIGSINWMNPTETCFRATIHNIFPEEPLDQKYWYLFNARLSCGKCLENEVPLLFLSKNKTIEDMIKDVVAKEIIQLKKEKKV